MGANTKIEWCNYTFNHVRGCTKVHQGCANCYAEATSKRNPKTLGIWGPTGKRVLAAESYWQQPTRWNRSAENAGERKRVFCASLADIFESWQGPMHNHKGERLFWSHRRQPHESVYHWVGEPETAGGEQPVTMHDVRKRLFELIDQTPHLDWLLLTKRPENVRGMWHGYTHGASSPFFPTTYEQGSPRLKRRANVWLGSSPCDQETAAQCVPELLKCRDLASVLFLSAEPLLGQIDLSGWLANNCIHSGKNHESVTGHSVEHNLNVHDDGYHSRCLVCEREWRDAPATLDFVIVGGESGPQARPCQVEWVRSIVRQCREAGVPCFVKQDSGPRPGMKGRLPDAIWNIKEIP